MSRNQNKKRVGTEPTNPYANLGKYTEDKHNRQQKQGAEVELELEIQIPYREKHGVSN